MKRPTHLPVAAALVLTWLSTAIAAANADPASARGVIDGVVSRVLTILRDAKLTPADRRAKVRDIAYQYMDFETLSRLALGKYWRALSDPQRTAFVEEFRKHLSNTYGHTFDEYHDEEVKVTGDRQEPNNDWTVQTRIIGNKNGVHQE